MVRWDFVSTVALVGAVELGLVFGFVALGVYLSFRVLSFPISRSTAASRWGLPWRLAAIVGGVDPFAATGLAVVAGALAGLVTAILNVRFRHPASPGLRS